MALIPSPARRRSTIGIAGRSCRSAVTAAYVIVLLSYHTTNAFGGFQLPKLSFGAPTLPTNGGATAAKRQQEYALLEAISNTNNGKTATVEQQVQVLRLVRNLETSFPIDGTSNGDFFTNPATTKLLNGTWFLQYTSPSQVDVDGDIVVDTAELSSSNKDSAASSWKPIFATEGSSNIETRPFAARGTVSAAGVTVDTSNRLVQQVIDVSTATVSNIVQLSSQTADSSNDSDTGSSVLVSGSFRPSPNISNRAIVAFDTAKIRLSLLNGKIGLTINLGLVFSLLALVRRSRDNGWLETTYLSDTMRIGRGNKGTMFILTRDTNALSELGL